MRSAGLPSNSITLGASASSAALLRQFAAGLRQAPQAPVPVTLPPVSPEEDGSSLQLLDFTFASVHDRVEISAQGFGRLVGDYTREQFSLTALQKSEDGGQTLIKVDFFHERRVAQIGGQKSAHSIAPPGASEGPGAPANGPASQKAIGKNPLSALLEAFAPDRVADRIADFAKGGFGHFLNGNEDSAGMRGAFRDFITPYIDRGYSEALDFLGDLVPEDIRSLLAKTRSLVDERLASFVEEGESAPSTAAPAGPAPTSVVDVTV